jgi:hypothetical protein
MTSSHPYRRAALWATIVVLVAWCAWWLPTKVFHASGAPPAGYLTSVGFHFLLPGSIASLFLFGMDIESPHDMILWQCVLVTVSWLFYFGVFSLITRLRRRSPQPLP